ncbi:reprolysin-like metallopeptidase [Algibacter sp. AS12]|uniref:zinc-dependent metalloprotease n=1 Tax=Algibacter sp. AS12 TaxID=3135773 RepID=UPI00398AC32C
MKHFYLKNCFYLLLFIFLSTSVFAQNTSTIWSQVSAKEALTGKKINRKTEPKKSIFYTLDVNQLKNKLSLASKNASGKITKNQIVEFPNSEGGFDKYSIKESSILEPAFQEKHPEIRTYVGKNIKNPASTINFSVTPQGLHAMALSTGNGTQFLDPYTKNNTYIAYSKRDLPALKEGFECYVPDDFTLEKETSNSAKLLNANDSKLRTFRLVLASTVEYSEYHWKAAGLTIADSEAAKKNAVLQAMVTTMTRVNGLFQKDLALKMVMVDNTDLIFIDSDNFTNDDADLLIDESQVEIDNAILSADYDIGHTFSTGGGGLASLNSPCVTARKAMGITGSSLPVGDAYDIDFVAHEMGHQFGAPHTFNGSTSNCAGNRESSNAYEPGSGSTIMAYAGLCSPQNIQSQSDVYFHQKSIQMIWDNITTGASTCSTESTLTNSAPTANAGANYTIPISTPYKLTGASTDADGTASHTYTWEQYDLGAAGLPQETNTTGPLVRSFEGTTNTTRYIPNLKDLKTSAGSTTWEKLASVDRAINFQLTVRDNNEDGGQTATDGMTVTTTANAGPFLVTSQNTTGISWSEGTTETITWDVAGTTGNGVNTANVNILLSTDGGLNYDTVLASNVPNDGSHDIVVPSELSAFCRVMVEAEGNIFFAINTEDFTIGYTIVETCTSYNSTDPNLPLTISDNESDFTEVSFVNVPATGTVSGVTLTVNISHNWPGDILLGLQSPEGNLITLLESYTPCQGEDSNLVVTFDDNGTEFNCTTTGDGLTMKSPSASLSGWNGEAANGNWLLGLGDSGVDDIGALNSWSIEVCSLELLPLHTTSFEFNDLVVYPNPNKGEFTIKLDSAASNNISVNIVDLRGRVIYNNTYTNSSNFEETLKLNNVQSGMYILNISDGIKQATKKIIIE